VFIVPLLLLVLPQTLGLMLCGASAWKAGVLRDPELHMRSLLSVFVVAFAIGGAVTVLRMISIWAGKRVFLSPPLLELFSYMPLAVSYGAAMLLLVRRPHIGKLTKLLAAAGQMALTNYLAQSVVLGFIFYGYGLGLFGVTGSAVAALISIALYIVQVFWSQRWLQHYRFGPAEWLWRSLTYGERQPMMVQTRFPGAK
jgi:uncharacterized protein